MSKTTLRKAMRGVRAQGALDVRETILLIRQRILMEEPAPELRMALVEDPPRRRPRRARGGER